MDILVMNSDLVPVKIIDTYKSLIWTERFRTAGDFEIMTTPDILSFVQKGYYLTRSDSDRVMVVEGFQIETSAENGNYVIVNGRSIESLLDRRIIWDQTTIDSKLNTAIKRLLNENAISPANSDRAIPKLMYKDATDSYIDGLKLASQFTGDNLYETIVSICEAFDIGWKITLQNIEILENLTDNAGNNLTDNNGNVLQAHTDTVERFVFELYPGVDRSYEQTDTPFIVFSPSFDNIINSNYVESDGKLKTLALVSGENIGDERRRITVGSGIGLERRELYVDARDLQSESQQMYDAENPNIVEGLSIDESRYIAGTTGEKRIVWVKINPNSEYTVTRTCPDGWHLQLCTGPDQPAVGASYDVMEYKKDDVPFDENGSIVSGPNDRYLGIILYWNADKTAGATFENATVDLTVRGPIPDADYEEMLTQRGQEKLAECKLIRSFDGEVDYNQQYKYGKDFFMGDICELENEYGISCAVRVIELVCSDDENGFSIYPTFTSYGGE